ncbi:MAG: flavodoxin domain-containing protein [Coriobacteriia bacterium]
MSSVLVVYGTSSGCTRGVAEKIGEALGGMGAHVDVRPASDVPDASAYDAVVVGSGVRAGQWHAAARMWVTEQAEALKERPVAFFTCGLTITDVAKTAEVRAYTDPLMAATGLSPVDVGLFAGWNEPAAFKIPERLVMKVMKAPVGDFRDWDAIADWSRSVAPRLGLAG